MAELVKAVSWQGAHVGSIPTALSINIPSGTRTGKHGRQCLPSYSARWSINDVSPSFGAPLGESQPEHNAPANERYQG